ncbi:conserved hypothetical protein [Pseudomonas sp. 8Z]|uniref:hypothetical protein n=1 Tax=Pseudomonas sp. 8Z TaxID=2653166 RepID=UPI0012EF281B|nr:hypothetical protein [Pseudomonas sp. 8Z]VXC76446.1 conserved hypothetical protein [Pseudomonas sp. 8Z]
MELFFGIVVVIMTLAIHFLSRIPEEPSLELTDGKARLTATEASELNRIFVLQGSAPDLAMQLAAPLWGDAWQLAHASLCARLMRQNREKEALELLWKLDSTHREQALQTTIQELVNKGDNDKALQVQKRFDIDCSSSPLTHATLLLAEGKVADARAALDTLDVNLQLDEAQLLQLARLRQACEQPEQADAALTMAETQLDHNDEPSFYWRPLLQTLAELQRHPRLLQLAQRSDLPRHEIVEILAAHGQYDDTLELLAATEKTYLIDAAQLFEHFIAAQRPELMQRLLATAKDNLAAQLLQCHISWHVQRGDIPQAQQLLDREMQHLHAALQHWLLLSLAEEHAPSDSSWVTSLQRQAERVLVGEQGKASWPGMRLHHLQYLLREQARRTPDQRDSWSVRNFLEEAERLHAQLDPENSLSERIVHSQLLGQLGERQAANNLLRQLREQLTAGEDIDAEEAPYYYNELVQALIDMGELEQAREMLALNLAEDHMSQVLMAAYIDTGRLEDALACIDLHPLIGNSTSNLQRLHQSIATLKEMEPQRSQHLHERLLERLKDNSVWGNWGQIHT